MTIEGGPSSVSTTFSVGLHLEGQSHWPLSDCARSEICFLSKVCTSRCAAIDKTKVSPSCLCVPCGVQAFPSPSDGRGLGLAGPQLRLDAFVRLVFLHAALRSARYRSDSGSPITWSPLRAHSHDVRLQQLTVLYARPKQHNERRRGIIPSKVFYIRRF